jgi:TRAP transporter TAXI family solute receptor
MKRGKWLTLFVGFALLIVASTLLGGMTADRVFSQTTPAFPRTLRFASFAPGTTLHAVSSGFAKVASDSSPMTVMVIATTGVPALLPMLSKHETADLAITGLESIWQIYTGKNAPDPVPKGFPEKPLFPAPTKNIRILIAGAPIPGGMLVRKDSGLQEIGELRGKKVAWEWTGFPNNVGITLANLFNGGLTLDDVKTVPVTEVVAAVKALQEKRLDGTACAVGMPAIAEADVLVGVRFLRSSMDPGRIKEGQRATPGCYPVIVKKGPPGVVEDTPIWGLPLAIMVSTRMPDHVAYKLIETWWEHYNDYAPIHPLLRQWTTETFLNKSVTAPYHNGSIQFFQKKGFWTSEMEKIQQRLLSE